MQKSASILRAAFLIFVLITCLSVHNSTRADRAEQSDPSRDLAAIQQVTSGIIAADNLADADAVIRFYADDAVLLPPNDLLIVGKAAIRARYESGFRQFRFDISSSSDETHVFGDWAFDRGTTAGKTLPHGDGQSHKIHDKYVMILHREPNGAWKIARLIWNGAEPVAPQE